MVWGDGALRAVGFDLERLEVTTDPVPVADGVLTKASGSASFGLAQNGSLAYVPEGAGSTRRTVVWLDRQGQEQSTAAEPRAYYIARISPDGAAVAFDVREPQVTIWIYDIEAGTLERLTDRGGYPVWTPDGQRVICLRGDALRWRAADGSGPEELLSSVEATAHDVSPDGALLVLRREDPETGYDVGILPLAGSSGEAEWPLSTPSNELNPALSRDGHWMAYASDESGMLEVYVRPFPNVEEGRTLVSQANSSSKIRESTPTFPVPTMLPLTATGS